MLATVYHTLDFWEDSYSIDLAREAVNCNGLFGGGYSGGISREIVVLF